MQPINYSIQTPDFGNSFAQGFNTVGGIMATAADYQRAQALATAQQQANELAMQKRADFEAAAANPTYENVRALMIKHPEYSEQFERSLKPLDAKKKENLMAGAFSVKSALEAGNSEAAMKLLDQNIEAAKRSGDEDMLFRMNAIKDMAIADPKSAILTLHGSLFGGLGSDGYEKLQKAQTEAATRDSTVRKGAADATKAETEAKYSAEQLLADIGLKKAQTVESAAKAGQANAAAAKDIEAANQAKSGLIPPEKRQEAETKLREEYYKRTADFQLLKDAYSRMESAQDSGAGDIALVYGFMKMNDPTSVVREGEFATAENSGGVEDKLRNLYNKALNGERLTPGQRKMFLGQAKALMNANGKSETEVRKHLTGVAQEAGLNVKNIFTEEAASRNKGEVPKVAPVASDVLSRLMQKYGAK